MGFRARLVVGLVLTVLLAAGAQALLGYTLYRAWLAHSAEGYVERFQRMLTPGIDLSGEVPRFDAGRLTSPPRDWSLVRYRLREGDHVIFEGPRPHAFPEDAALWTTGGRPLDSGHRFEVALNLEEIRQSLADYRRTTLVTLAATLGLAIGFIALLFRFSMQPIRRLTDATRALSRRDFRPVRVPPGNDEVSQLARSFNRMSEELGAYIERERSFTRYASHELRTPLSTLRAQVEALELDLLTAHSVVPALKETLARMERILAGLLTLARANVTSPESVPMAPLVREVIEALPDEARERVSAPAVDEGPCAAGQPELLKQALSNLLTNALTHGRGRVAVHAGAESDHVTVAVRDEGDGVPEPLLHKLPEPFFQVDRERGDGIGLGLTLVRHVTDSLGGRLELGNTPTGFEARLILPRGR